MTIKNNKQNLRLSNNTYKKYFVKNDWNFMIKKINVIFMVLFATFIFYERVKLFRKSVLEALAGSISTRVPLSAVCTSGGRVSALPHGNSRRIYVCEIRNAEIFSMRLLLRHNQDASHFALQCPIYEYA